MQTRNPEADRSFLSAIMGLSSKAYPHAPFAMFYWIVRHRQSGLDIAGRTGPRSADVLHDNRLDIEWLDHAERLYARGGRELHRLSMDSFATALRSIPRKGSDDYAKAGVVAVGVFANCYEYALLSYGDLPFGHGVIRSEEEAFKVIEGLSPSHQGALVSLIHALNDLQLSHFDLTAPVNHKIQEARIEWQHGKLPTAGYHATTRRRAVRA